MIDSISSGGYASMIQPPSKPPDAASLSEELIAEADTDGDGSISKSEFTALIESQESGSEMSSEDIDELYAQLDADGDEALTAAEVEEGIDSLLEQMRAEMPPPPPPPADEESGLFSEADTDGNGSIDQAEFATLLQSSPMGEDADESVISAMFAEADTDGDGTLSAAEMQAAMPPPPPPPGGAQEVEASSDSEDEDTLSPLISALISQYNTTASSDGESEASTVSLVA